jgi:transcriptional regulator with XRE-family HTH domain
VTDVILNARSLPLLGQAIRSLRLDRHLTQAQLAARADVSRQWVVAVERGDTRGAEVGLVMRVLDALDASLTVRDDRVDEG